MGDRPRFLWGIPLRGPLSHRLSVSFRTIMIMMVVPAIISVLMMIGFSQLYYSFLSRAERINDLNAVVVDTLTNELFNIVAGRGSFKDGPQEELLRGVNDTLDSLIKEGAASRLELTVARRTGDTLGGYIKQLGEQMERGATVEENFLVHEEIRNVSSLMADMFRDAVSTEIQAATKTSRQLRTVLAVTTALEAALIVFALVFIKSSQRTLSSAVADPIKELQAFAGRIADGHLSERTPEPDVDELRALSNSLNTMAGRLGGLMEENRLEQESLKKSELRVLQAQVTPHFLYNTLDAIVWLAEAQRTDEVIHITRALSDFFRISLSQGRDWIPLSDEIKHLQGYLTIQKIRYRDILDYEIDIPQALYDRQILKLLLQPLVENAIYHGIKHRRGRGFVRVKGWEQEGRMVLVVQDNGAGMTAERLAQVRENLSTDAPTEGERGCYGLFNVNKRIQLYYNQTEGVRIESGENGTSVSLCVPFRRKDDVQGVSGG